MAKYMKTEQGYQEIETTVAPVVNQEIETTVVPMVGEKMDKNNPVGTGSFSMGRKPNTVIGSKSHAEGQATTASGNYSHAEGYATTASGDRSHAEGYVTTASSYYSHAEGVSTIASGESSHAEGGSTTASGHYSHAEGSHTTASGINSHAEGDGATASGDRSHAEGWSTTASSQNQHVQGKFNVEDSQGKYTHIVGNGTKASACSNAHTLDWNGNAWFAGDVYTGSTSGTNRDEGSKKLATEEYVDSKQDTLIQSGASVGQIAKITAVDSNGKPTAWQAVDMPASGSGEEDFELIFMDTVTEDVNEFNRNVDKDGNPFELKEAVVIVYTVPFETAKSDLGRGVGFLPSTSWGHNTPAGISNSLPAGKSDIAKYDVVHVKVVQGYQCLIDRWGSQNSTNVRGIMTKINIAGQVPINFKYGDNVTAIGELSNPQGNLTCVKIVSYGLCMAKGDVVILYGKRV